MWQSSSKPDREPGKEGKNYLYIALLGFIGLLMEAVGVWLLFSWYSAVPRNTSDPNLFIGGVLVFAGFVVLTRGLAALIKALMK